MTGNQILFGVVVVPAVIGLTQVAKEVGIPSRFAPLIALSLGVLAGMAQLYASRLPWIGAIVVGISLGLSAVGLYSGTTSFFTPTTPTANPGDITLVTHATDPRTTEGKTN